MNHAHRERNEALREWRMRVRVLACECDDKNKEERNVEEASVRNVRRVLHSESLRDIKTSKEKQEQQRLYTAIIVLDTKG